MLTNHHLHPEIMLAHSCPVALLLLLRARIITPLSGSFRRLAPERAVSTMPASELSATSAVQARVYGMALRCLSMRNWSFRWPLLCVAQPCPQRGGRSRWELQAIGKVSTMFVIPSRASRRASLYVLQACPVHKPQFSEYQRTMSLLTLLLYCCSMHHSSRTSKLRSRAALAPSPRHKYLSGTFRTLTPQWAAANSLLRRIRQRRRDRTQRPTRPGQAVSWPTECRSRQG